jgi:hypothetical protein
MGGDVFLALLIMLTEMMIRMVMAVAMMVFYNGVGADYGNAVC